MIRALNRRHSHASDDGLTLVETVVSLVILALFAAAAAAMMATALGTSRTNRLRVQASELASRQIEVARNTDVRAVPNGLVYGTAGGGTSATPQTISLNGTAFTVVQNSEYVPANSTASSCSAPSGSRLAYKRVSVTVTWPTMGSAVPPRADTLLRLPVTGLDVTKGVLSVPVKDANGTPVQNASVTVTEGAATRGTAVTGDDGCAVIDGLTPANDYVSSVVLGGYVDTSGVPAPSHAAPTVSAATLVQDGGFVIDQGAAAQIALTPPVAPPPGGGSWALPTTPFDVTLTNSTPPTYQRTYKDCANGGTAGYCSTGTGFQRLVGSANDTNSNMHGLFPFTTASRVYINDYGDSAAPNITVGLTKGQLVTTTTPAGGVPVGGVQITNRAGGNVVLYAFDSSVASNNLIQLNPTGIANNTIVNYALPYGTWCFGKNPNTNCVASQQKVIGATSQTVTVTQ